jgi:hypothetical protein
MAAKRLDRPTPTKASREHRLKAEEAKLTARLEAIRTELNQSPDVSGRLSSGKTKPVNRSIRDLVTDSLGDIGFVTYSQQLSVYIKMKFGRDVPASRYGSLSAEERKAFEAPNRRTARPVWLVHGITQDRAEPVKRLWGRSDWDLVDRVVTAYTARVQYLRFTIHLIDLVLDKAPVSDSGMLKFSVVDLVRGLGIKVRNGEFDAMDEWRAAAAARLTQIEEKDKEVRIEAASRLLPKHPEADLLFGSSFRWQPQLVGANDDSTASGRA